MFNVLGGIPASMTGTLKCSNISSSPTAEGPVSSKVASHVHWLRWSEAVSFLGGHNKAPQIGGLRQQKIILSQFQRPEVQTPGVHRIVHGTDSRESVCPVLVLAAGVAGRPGLVEASPPSPPLPSRGVLRVCVCVFLSCSYKDTGQIGSRAHPAPVSSQLMTFATALFPSRVAHSEVPKKT